MKRSRTTVKIVMLVGVLGASASSVLLAATLTSITYAPTPIIVGYGTTYTAKDDGTHPINSYKWEYDCLGTPCEGGTMGVGGSTTDTWQVNEPYVGSCTVKCTATFGSVSDPNHPDPPPPSSKSINVTVAGPDTEALGEGPLGVEVPLENIEPDQRLIVHFEWKSGSTRIGPYAAARPEEFITHIDPTTGEPYPVGHEYYKVGPWEGPFEGTYYFEDGYTIDGKAVSIGGADDSGLPVGYVYREFTQKNRLIIKDCCGQDQIFYGAERRFRMVKSSGGNWKLIQL